MTRNDTLKTDLNRYSRRQVLAAGTVAAAAIAGCTGSDEPAGDDESGETADTEPPEQAQPNVELVENPPDVVYKPTHEEGMVMEPRIQAGDYTLLPHFTYEHTFWLMRGDGDPIEEAPTEPGVHLMFAVLDAETGEQLPLDIVSDMTVRQDGELVDRRDPWPMIAQSMGMHFGDNIPLEYGSYEVEVQLDPINARKTGAFEERFEEGQTATYTLEYDDETRRELIDGIEWRDEAEWGEPGALDLLDHDGHGNHDQDDGHGDHDDSGAGDHGHPRMDLPPAEEYPGTDLGVHSSGDADFVVRHLEDSRLAEDGDDYLLVSPRTPYNRIPLADMSLSVAGDIDGELVQTLDDELGHHYGLAVDLDGVESFEIVVETPPQVARHQGYETAFIEMPAMTVDVDAGEHEDGDDGEAEPEDESESESES